MPALANRFDASAVRWRFDLMTEVLGLDRERAWTLGRGSERGAGASDGTGRTRVYAALMIRTATAADVPVIHAMVRELADYEKALHEANATEEQLREALFGERPAAYAHIAESDEDGEIVGFALWFLNFSTWRGVHGIYLEDLYVRPDRRGGGHGKALLTELARICVERGYERLEWSVLDWNAPSIAFYDSLGARPQDEWTVYRLTDGALAELGS
jgi:GNAT superfamily N-acetyltransferase